MKVLGALAYGALAFLLIAGSVSESYAAQLTAFLIPGVGTTSQATLTGVKILTMDYPAGSTVANGIKCDPETKRATISFQVNGTGSQDNGSGMSDVISTVNAALVREFKSTVQVSSASLSYTGTIKCADDNALISYKVEFKPVIENFVLKQGQGNEGDLIDLNWRALVLDMPLVVQSPQNGKINVNHPIGLFQALFPEIAQKLNTGGAAEIMQDPILSFEKFKQSLNSWHFLFDPTGSLVGTSGYVEEGGARVVSVYSLGESSFREGTFKPEEKDVSVAIDGANVKLHSSTPPPSGQLQIAGFMPPSAVQEAEGNEFGVVTRQAPEGAYTSTGGFPIQVLLVFGGMMGAIAIFILFKARK